MKISRIDLSFVSVVTRVPLKFGNQTLTEVSCARVAVHVEGEDGRVATGWAETPLSVAWVWPSDLGYGEREDRLKEFCKVLRDDLVAHGESGHPMAIGHRYIEDRLHDRLDEENEGLGEEAFMPHLAGLVCLSAFDLALYDAFGKLHEVKAFESLTQEWLGEMDLSHFLEPTQKFLGKYPGDYLVTPEMKQPVWHLVGGLDAIDESELTGEDPDDGYPVLLRDWIQRDGLDCLKIKLRGNDLAWDYDRLVAIGKISLEEGVTNLTTDFNCMVTDPEYVNEILDRLKEEESEIYDRIVYVEQPFPYDLEANRIDVHSVSERKPLFMDESAHDWRFVRLGLELGWTSVALKTCKTLTGALLSLCWAKEHGMTLMVQDLTNPRLAQVPHVLLAAYAGTICGVESNGMQFYPEASSEFFKVHPGLYQRRGGILDLSTLSGPGFGYAGVESL
ncbi:mandelate racemase/muconate lactonizing enzyme family protein [Akkermansiaceae bacterium]|nr:mandelate racemase/muconate lactonizing enzyme family protein [Akkermansiaceae bacterium]MDB4726892.1 mandelate racemase/muconate lactonizing enzyme family protein [bacterium]